MTSPSGYLDPTPKAESVSVPDVVISTAPPDSPLALHRKVFEGSGWRSTLARLYPSFRLIEFGNSYFPIWAEVAQCHGDKAVCVRLRRPEFGYDA